MPTPVGLSGVNAVAAFDFQTCATSGLYMYCWGSISDGTHTIETPTKSGPGNAKAIAVGGSHDCAILSGANDGQLECWYSNKYGQLGDGTLIDRVYSAPVVWP